MPDTPSQVQIGRTIKLVRIARNMSQTELATAADLSVSYVSLIERGKRDMNMSTLEAIAKALVVPLPIIMFLAIDREKMTSLDPVLAEKLASAAMKLIRASNEELK